MIKTVPEWRKWFVAKMGFSNPKASHEVSWGV
jgi:hypothetical protein